MDKTELQETQAMAIRQNGFSLVELMVAMVISLIAIGAIYQVFQSVNRSYRMRTVAQEAAQDMRIAMDIMVRDMRMAGYDPEDANAFGIVVAAADRFEFTADLDRDSQVLLPYVNNDNWRGEHIGYRLNGEDLEMLIVDNSTAVVDAYPLVSGIVDLTFTYFDREGAPAADIVDIATADVSLTLERFPDALNQDRSIVRTLSSRVRFRNLNLE